MTLELIGGIVSSPFLSLCGKLELREEQSLIIHRIELWANPLLAWIPSKMPYFTDHGILHSKNVLEKIIILLEQYPAAFNKDQKFLLALAAKLHDIGCIIDRTNHHKHSLKIINSFLKEDLVNEIGYGLFNCLKQIIVSHSKKYNLNHIIKYEHDDIKLGLICSIFRLADALDQTKARISKSLYSILKDEKILNDESNDIWKAHMSIKNIEIKKTKITIYIEDFVYSDIILRSLDDELRPINDYLNNNGYESFERIIRTEEMEHISEDEKDSE